MIGSGGDAARRRRDRSSVSDVRMRPHSVWPRRSWLKPALEMPMPRPYGTCADRGVRRRRSGTPRACEYDAVRFGAPGGGMHWPGPLPMLTWKRESDPSVMPTLSSATSNSGDSSIRPRPAPTGPEIEMPASVCWIAAAIGLSCGPAPSGSLRKPRMPSVVADLDVRQERLNDVADDRRIAQAGGERVVEAAEAARRAGGVDAGSRRRSTGRRPPARASSRRSAAAESAVRRRPQSGTSPLPLMSTSTRRLKMRMSPKTTLVCESIASVRLLNDGGGLAIDTWALPQQPMTLMKQSSISTVPGRQQRRRD